jgi:hypothetical protein
VSNKGVVMSRVKLKENMREKSFDVVSRQGTVNADGNKFYIRKANTQEDAWDKFIGDLIMDGVDFSNVGSYGSFVRKRTS